MAIERESIIGGFETIRTGRKGRDRRTQMRNTEREVSSSCWIPKSKFLSQIEELGEDRILGMEDKLFNQTIREESLRGLSQDEISIQYIWGNIPDQMSFIEFVEMIETAPESESLEEDIKGLNIG